ncbi:hypothetical protein ADAWI_74 [Mycobacterium phage Adawi]|uniref:Uncharacterized protein n=1 Tax=Mycobacterium phage Adawi TaxID=1354507 RepID=T2A8Y7_9CAUD|nr:hypothetical protein ADAWI_74 [Mycobacterium phage Adawi]AGU91987.1 hypothetical protein ADAWI_74 [Mycobacterium phage Adawi]
MGGRVPRVAAKGFRDQDRQFERLGAAVQAMHDHGGGTVRQVPDGFAFTPLVAQPAPRLAHDGTVVGKPVVEPGVQTCLDGSADWCQGCGQCRYRHDMRWLVDTYRCRVCLGQGVGTAALWCPPAWATAEPEVVAWPWASWRQAGYVALTAVLVLVFLASALGALG